MATKKPISKNKQGSNELREIKAEQAAIAEQMEANFRYRMGPKFIQALEGDLKTEESKVVFKTGATRRQVKPSLMSHIPAAALEALGERYQLGAINRGYGAWNWEAGIPYWNLIQHAFTHLSNLGNQLSNARWVDSSDSITQNAAAVMWAMAAIIHFQKFGNPADQEDSKTRRKDSKDANL